MIELRYLSFSRVWVEPIQGKSRSLFSIIVFEFDSLSSQRSSMHENQQRDDARHGEDQAERDERIDPFGDSDRSFRWDSAMSGRIAIELVRLVFARKILSCSVRSE